MGKRRRAYTAGLGDSALIRAYADISRAARRSAAAEQTCLRTLGIEITFDREARTGTRIVRIRATREGTVSTVSSICDQSSPRPASAICNGSCRSDLVSRDAIEQVPAATDDADGAHANAALRVIRRGRDRGACRYLRMTWQGQAAALLEARRHCSFPLNESGGKNPGVTKVPQRRSTRRCC
jgi:hypothetical protein